MVYDPVERARRERIRYHKNKQAFISNGGVMPSEEKRRKSKEETDNYNIPTRDNKIISVVAGNRPNDFNPFKLPVYIPPKPKPVFNKNGLQKKKNDDEYADDSDDEIDKTEPPNKYTGFRFY
jgi:hypothetical protein